MTILKSLVGFPQKGECDLGKLLLQEFLFLSIRKAVLVFSQWPLSFPHKILFFDIWVQILCDICNST